VSILHSVFQSVSNIAQTNRAHGIDISKYDKFFKPETATTQLDFVIQRIGYGVRKDEAFDTLVDGVMRVPIRGGYHYLSSGVDWKRQADLFLEHTANKPYHFFACDFEGAFNTMSSEFAYSAWRWITYVANVSKKKTVLYTNPSNYTSYIIPSSRIYGINWESIDFWVAQYNFTPNPNAQPAIPKGRQSWHVWQYTDKGDGTKYGVARPTACDLNVFNGTKEQMAEWLKIDNHPPPTNEPSRTIKIEIYSDASYKITEE